jgi:hypothetical protein
MTNENNHICATIISLENEIEMLTFFTRNGTNQYLKMKLDNLKRKLSDLKSQLKENHDVLERS